jgi:VCBS repeat protein
MTTPRLIKSIGRSSSRLALLLIPLVFACFALSPMVQAVALAPDGDYAGNDTAEGTPGLQDNGGPTQTVVPPATGLPINLDDPAAPPQDQSGYGDIGVPDVGAFEYGGASPEVASQRYDFNGDGYPDYVIENETTHRTAIIYLNNNVTIGSAWGPTLLPGWSLVDVADFNGDGHPDYVLFDSVSRLTAIWYLNNNVYVSGALGPRIPEGWDLRAVGDFNGNGKPDYVLSSGLSFEEQPTEIWYMNNNVRVSAGNGPPVPAGWRLAGAADFNLDGHADYLLRNRRTRQTGIWYMSGRMLLRGVFGPTLPSGWQLKGAADFNRDGHLDYVLEAGGSTQIWYLNNNVRVVGQAPGPNIPTGWILRAP